MARRRPRPRSHPCPSSCCPTRPACSTTCQVRGARAQAIIQTTYSVHRPILPSPPPTHHHHPGHFERPQRVTAILEALKASRLLPPHAFCLDGEAAAPRVTRLALERFHTKAHVDKVGGWVGCLVG